MSEYILELDHVSKKFRRGQLHDSLRDLIPSLVKSFVSGRDSTELGQQEFWALRDVSMHVRPGEAVGIIGHNGAGKSTILKILTGIMNPTSGTKRVEGSLSALIEVGAGFHPDLTGRENIFLNGTILGMSRAEIRAKLDDIVEFSGLADFIDTPVKRYSSGMYARLGFSIACHVEPDILIVDEVLSVGDWAFQNRSMERMQETLRGGSTVIFVSHNLKAVTELCDRVILLEQGSIAAEGDPQEMVDTYIKHVTSETDEGTPEGAVAAIDRVSLRNASSEEAAVFTPGDHAVAEVQISSRSCTEPLSVALALRDEEFELFFYADSTRLLHEPLIVPPGETRTVTFDLDMHLAPGSYYLNISLVNPWTNDVLDSRRPAKTFVVHSEVDVRGVANLYPRLTVS